MNPNRHHKTIGFPLKVLCLTWLVSLVLSGSSPLFYLGGQSGNSDSNHHSSLLVTASAEDALAARLKTLGQKPSDGGMGSPPISGSVNLWLLAGQSVLTGGATSDRRISPSIAIQPPRRSTNGLGSVSRELSLAGAEKRLEFTQLALRPTGVS